MGNARNSVILGSVALLAVNHVVLHVGPSLGSDVLLEFVRILVETEADNADLVAPGGRVVLEHLLVVSHRCLAGRAPCCPEV